MIRYTLIQMMMMMLTFVCHKLNEYIVTEDIPTLFNNTSGLADKLHISSFDMIHVNCRSLSSNFNELEALVYNSNTLFSAIAVSETWLNSTNCDLFQLNNYNFFSSTRNLDRRGGGVGVYINREFSVTLCTDLKSNDTCLECVFLTVDVKLIHNPIKILVGCLYRPPNSDLQSVLTVMESLLNVIEAKYKGYTILLAGDFNLDLLKLGNNINLQQFIDTQSCLFFPTITKPTRVTNNFATLIDNTFCNNFSLNS